MSADEWVGIRIFMKDRRRFQSEANAAAGSVEALEQRMKRLSAATAEQNKRSWLMNQALFTMRRLAYGATLAFAGLAIGVATIGFKFDSLMDKSRIAFKTLLGSASAANKELSFLFNLAAKTPFTFESVQQAAKQFLAWGFSLKQTNRYLAVTSNLISAMGGDTQLIDRIVLALGQIHTAGVLRGQEIRQLTEAGVPVFRYLNQQLGITQRQFSRIGSLGLRGDVAIEAIMKGINTDPRFKGAAQALAGTVSGQASILHDYMQRLFGELMMAPFKAVKRNFPGLIKDIIAMSDAMNQGGFSSFANVLDRVVGAQGRLKDTLMTTGHFLAAFGRIWVAYVLPAIKLAAIMIYLVLVPSMKLLTPLLNFLANHSLLLSFALRVLVFWLIITRLNMMRLWLQGVVSGIIFMSKLRWGMLLFRVGLIRTNIMLFRLRIQMFLLEIQMRGLRAAIWSSIMASRFMAVAFRANLIWIMIRVRIAAFRAALVMGMLRIRMLWLAYQAGGLSLVLRILKIDFIATWIAALGPIAWIVAGIVLLVAIIIGLYFKWKWFHNLVNRTANWIWDHKAMIAKALLYAFNPILVAIKAMMLLYRLWQRVKGIFGGGKGTAKPSFNDPNSPGNQYFKNNLPATQKLFPSSGTRMPGSIFPALAGGGSAAWPGWSMVGERGPELLHLGRGASVVPLDGRGVDPLEGVLVASVPVQLVLDRRVLAEANAKVRLERRARK